VSPRLSPRNSQPSSLSFRSPQSCSLRRTFRSGPRPQKLDDRAPHRAPLPRTCVPPRPRRKRPIVPLRDIPEGTLRPSRVQRRIHKSSSHAILLVGKRNQPRPQRRHRTRAPDRHRLPIHANLVTRRRIRIPSNIRSPASARRGRRRRHLRTLLPRRQRKQRAHSAARRSFADRQFIPHHLARDRCAGTFQRSSTACQHVRARRWKVHVVPRSTIRRTIVTAGHRNRDTHRRRCLARRIQRRRRLCRPARLRPSPTDRNHARLIRRVVHRRRHRVDKSLVRIRRKIHGDLGSRRNRSAHLDIQHDLSIRTVRGPRSVLSSIHRNRRNRWCRQSQRLEVRRHIRFAIATAQLDQSDRLPTGRRSRRKSIQRSYLHRRVRHVGSVRLCYPKVRPRLRPIVQTQHRHHMPAQLFRKIDRPFPQAKGPSRSGFSFKRDSECLLHRSQATAETNCARARPRRSLHRQSKLLRKCLDQLHRRRIRSMTNLKLLARKSFRRRSLRHRERRLRRNNHRHRDRLPRRRFRRSCRCRHSFGCKRLLLTARQGDSVLGCKAACGFHETLLRVNLCG